MADRLDQIRKQREKRDTSLSSASTNTDRLTEIRKKRDSQGFLDALNSGMEAMNTAYSGWQSPEAMAQYKNTIDTSAGVMDKFIRSYGGDDYVKAFSDFNDRYSGWGDMEKFYSNFVTADAFNNARRDNEIKSKYSGSSFEDIQKALSETTDSKERSYLRNFTDYSTSEDFDKAINSIEDRYASNGKQIVNVNKQKLMQAKDAFEKMHASQNYAYLKNNEDFASITGNKDLDTDISMWEIEDLNRGGLKNNTNNRVVFGQLNDELKDYARYLFANDTTEDKSEYREFMDKVAFEAGSDFSERMEQAWADWTNQNFGTGLVGSVVNTLGGVVTEAGTALQTLSNPHDMNPFLGMAGLNRAVNASQAELSESVNEVNPFLGKLYQAGTEGVKNRGQQAVAYTLFGPSAGTVINTVIGTSAYAQAYGDNLRAGKSEEEAKINALVKGFIEFATEQAGMDWAFGAGKTGWGTLLRMAGAEGSEEVVGNVAESLYDKFFNGGAQFNEDVQAYVDRGYSVEEARRLVYFDWIEDTANQATVAAFSAGMTGAVTESATARQGKKINAEAFQQFMEGSDNERYNELLKKYNNEFGKASNWQKGAVFNEELRDAYQTRDAEKLARLSATIQPTVKTKKNVDNVDNVDIQSVETEGKKTFVVDAQGNRMDTKQLNLAEDDAYIVKRASELEAPLAELYLLNRAENVTAYDANFQLAKAYAESNIPMTMLEGRIDTNVMKLSTAIDVYKATKKLAQSEAVAIQQKNEAIAKTFDGKYKAGKFDVSALNMQDLAPSEKRVVQMLGIFSRMGMNITVVNDASLPFNGKTTSTGITINLAASYSKDGPIDIKYAVSSFAHETTHMMKNILGKEFDLYQNMVKDYMGTEWDKMVARRMATHKISEEEAIDEVVARFSEDMLNDMTVADKLFAQAEESKIKRLITAIRKWVSQIREDLKKLMSGYNSQAPEAQMLKAADEAFAKFQDEWTSMLEKALKINAVNAQKFEAIENDENTIVTEDAIQLSEKTYEVSGKDYLEVWLKKQVKRGQLTSEEVTEIMDAMDEAYRISKEMSDEGMNPNFVDYREWQKKEGMVDALGNAINSIVSNGDYPFNIDMATVCKKRKALDAVLNALVTDEVFEKYLPSERCVTEILDEIKSQGFEIACALCFVDAKRYRIGSWANNLLNGFDTEGTKDGKKVTVHSWGFNEMLWKLAKIEGVKVRQFDFLKRDLNNLVDKGKTLDQIELSDKGKAFLENIFATSVKGSNNQIRARLFLDNPEQRKIIKQGEILSSIGFDAMRKDNPEIFNLIKGASGSATPKLSLSEIAWTDEVLKDADKLSPKKLNEFRDKLYKVGGYRFQSFSDYMANMFFDYVQMISNFATLRLPAHAYTKEDALVKIFGLTGAKINMSIIPKAWAADVEKRLGQYHNLDLKPKKYDDIREEYEFYKAHSGMAECSKDEADYYDAESKTYWKYIMDDESFDFNEAVRLQNLEGYDKNCGIIFVGVSHHHILALLRDERIPMVIPYHKSNINPIVAHLRGIAGYNDYTDAQGAKYLKKYKDGTEKWVNLVSTTDDAERKRLLKKYKEFNFYDALAEAEKEWTPASKKNVAQMAGDKYIAFCDSIGVKPKFDEFRNEPNYYKLLADFRLIDSKGNYAPQGAVTMKFPETATLKKYVTESLGAAQQTSDDFSAKQKKLLKECKNIIARNMKEDAKFSEKVDSEGFALTEAQAERFKNSKARDKEGRLQSVFHGTTREFYTFDRQFASAEGDWGKGFYFSNSEIDVWDNYANEEGGDLTNKIEHEADMLEGLEEYEGMTHDEIVDSLKEKYITTEPYAHKCYVNIENPCYPYTYLFEQSEILPNEDDYETEDDYLDALDVAYYDYVDGIMDKAYDIADADMKDIFEAYDGQIRNAIHEAVDMDGMKAQDFKDKLDNMYIEDGNGEYVSNEVARILIEALGYDGIIDDTVSGKFKGMRLSKDTIHYIVFNSNQAKLVDNENPTDNDDIRYSEKEEGTLGLSPERIDKLLSGGYYGASNPNYAQAYIAYMSPDDFLKLTTGKNQRILERIKNWQDNEWDETDRPPFDMETYADTYNGQPIRLTIDEENNEVYGHEGRHRMWQLKMLGYKNVPVLIFNPDNKYDKHFIESIDLMPQTFNSEKDVFTHFDRVRIKDLIPFSQGNRDLIKEKFGTNGTLFSEKISEDALADDGTNLLEFLNKQIDNGEYYTTYKSMRLDDGKLHSPMAELINGKWENDYELGEWYKAVEHPEMRTADNKFNLKKRVADDLSTVPAAYNPYEHSVNIVFNDQFSTAYKRPELVTVEMRVPKSEDTSGYHAEFAKDSVGWTEWNSGTVSKALAKKGTTRKLFLSRYAQPVRILPNSEVAQRYKELLDGTGISVPWNVVNEDLRHELEKAGVTIDYSDVYFATVKGQKIYLKFADVFPNEAEKAGQALTKYSEKVRSEIDDILKTSKTLEKQNAILKADIGKLRKRIKLDHTVTGGKMADERKLEIIAKQVLKDFRSDYSLEGTKAGLKDAYEYLLRYLNTKEDDFDWDFYMGKLYNVAQQMVSKSKPMKIVDDYYKGILSSVRNARIKLTAEQKQELKNFYGDDWRNYYLGKVTIVNDGRTLDSYWSEWAEMYPEVFDADANVVDQATAILDIYDMLKNHAVMMESLNTSENVIQAAQELYDKFWQVPAEYTTADKHADEIKRLKFEHRKAMDELRADRNNRLKELRDRKDEIIKAIRDKRDADFKAYKEYVKNKADKKADMAKKQAIIKKITDVSNTLMDWMLKDNAKTHVGDALKPAVMQLLNAIDFSSKQLLGIGTQKNAFIPTNKDISIRKAIEDIQQLVGDSTTEEAFNELGTYVQFPPHYNQMLLDMYKELNNIAVKTGFEGAYMLQAMSTEGLENLYDLVKTMKRMVQTLNAAIAGANKFRITEAAAENLRELTELGKRDTDNVINKFFEFKNALPVYAFERMGSGFSKMFNQVMDGWEQLAFNQRDILNFTETAFTAEEVKEWEKDIREFTIKIHPTEAEVEAAKKAGNEFPEFNKEVRIQMTVAQMMSLYCLSKREHATGHFRGDGIRIATIKDGKKEIVQNNNVRLSKEALDTILNGENGLNERQKEVADKLQGFMNKECTNWINEVSMKLWDIKLAKEENYFPIQVDNKILTKEARNKGRNIYALLNYGWSKPLTPNASVTMVIDDIFSVFSTHASEVAKYNALALPALDLIRFYNYYEKDELGEKYGIQQALENAFGNEASAYVIHFLDDLSTDKENIRNEGFLMKRTRGYKTAAVAANLQVAALQPISIFRTLAVIDPKYFASGIMSPQKIKHGMDVSQTYSGIAVYKHASLFDTNLSRGLDSKIRKTGTWYDKTIEKSMKLAGFMDDITWGAIWNMCEKETFDKTGLTGEDLYNETAKRFRDVVIRTQVTDSTVTRTDLMRSPSVGVQWATSFMGEPSVTMNVLTDSFLKFNLDARKYGKGEALKRNGRNIARATFVYTLGAFVEATMRAIGSKYRNPDEEDSMVEIMWEEFLQNMNPMSNIPILRDILSIWQGYNVERMDMATAQDFRYAWSGWEKVINGEDLTYKVVYRTLKAVSELTGIPASGALREVVSFWNATIGNAFDLKIK